MSQSPTPTLEDRAAHLREIGIEVQRCRRCDLYKFAHKGVPGEGDPNAEVMLIGEAPGWHENQQGRPFVGAAGKFLEQLLHSVGLERSEVFIANVVKHRPPDNRDPLPEEIVACSGFLDRQIALVDPLVIVTLGRFSLNRFFPGERISHLHGMPRRQGDRYIFPMYHPAAALHQGSLRRTIEEDFLRLPTVVQEARALRTTPAAALPAPTAPPTTPQRSGGPQPPQQLTLF